MSASFSLHMSRTRALVVAACFVAAGILLFVAGTASGLLLASASGAASSGGAQSVITKSLPAPTEKPPAPAKPLLPASETAEATTTQPIAASVPSLMAVPPAPPPAAAASPKQASAAATETAATAANEATATTTTGKASGALQPSAQSSYSIPLAIKVCSFTGKASAETLITSLAAKGYHASLGHSIDAQGRNWYVVKLGPYTEWNAASTVAAQIAVAENVRPVIGPER